MDPNFMRKIDEIHTAGITTATDVKWIKDEIERGRAKFDDHGKRIGALETNQSWRSRVSVMLAAALGAAGVHFTKVMVAAAVISALLPALAHGQTVDARRAAIIEKVRSIGVYPGAEFEVFGAVYRIEAVTVDANYTLIVKTKVVR